MAGGGREGGLPLSCWVCEFAIRAFPLPKNFLHSGESSFRSLLIPSSLSSLSRGRIIWWGAALCWRRQLPTLTFSDPLKSKGIFLKNSITSFWGFFWMLRTVAYKLPVVRQLQHTGGGQWTFCAREKRETVAKNWHPPSSPFPFVESKKGLQKGGNKDSGEGQKRKDVDVFSGGWQMGETGKLCTTTV